MKVLNELNDLFFKRGDGEIIFIDGQQTNRAKETRSGLFSFY